MSQSDGKKLTPMMAQYLEAKKTFLPMRYCSSVWETFTKNFLKMPKPSVRLWISR